MLRALGDYGRLMVYPSNLHMERTVVDGENYGSNRSWRNSVRSEYLSMLGLAVLSVAIYGASRKETGQSLRIFGAAWFFLAYLPTSNIVELNATVAEHWLYLPSVGFLLFVAGCALALPKRFEKPLAIFASVAVLALGLRSYVRSTDWATPETFYERTVAAGGTSTRVSVNLAQLYARRGEYARAEAIYRNVLKMMPDYPIARNSLAEVLFRQGKREEAEALFVSSNQDAAVSRKEYPRTWIAALNLAHLRFGVQDIEGTLAVLDKAHAEYPSSWEIISFEAEVLRQARGPDAALHLVEDFARTNWWHYAASLALGRLYAEKGDVPRAEAALRHASWLDVHDAEALNLIARMDLRQNRLEAALRSQRRALARQPDQTSQYLLLSEILQKMGRNDEADASTAQVSRLQALAQAELAAN